MTEYFWFVILAAVVVFLTFLIVPILFSIKDLSSLRMVLYLSSPHFELIKTFIFRFGTMFSHSLLHL